MYTKDKEGDILVQVSSRLRREAPTYAR
jgi:hypothetical protein